MNDCRTCGRKIRYRVMRVSINRKPGVAAWLETEDQPQCPCLKAFAVDQPRRPAKERHKPSACDAMIKRWNDENPALEPAP